MAKAKYPGVGRGYYPRSIYTLTCQHCQREYTAKRSDSKYCPLCRQTVDQKLRAARYEAKRDPCVDCGQPKHPTRQRCRSCAAKERNRIYRPNYKGGRVTNGEYLAIRRPRGKAPYTLEHIAVWEDAHGPVPPNHHVHHLNGVKTDNRLENLIALAHTEHPHWNRQPYEARIRHLEECLRAAGLPID